jgi:hypothetical protein
MTGAKGCQDDFAAFIIFALNSVLLILTILGLVGTIYVWIMQADIVTGGEQALSVAIPEFILSTAIFASLVVMSIALLGIIATAIQMKANKDARDGAEKTVPVGTHTRGGKQAKKKGCCHLWGLGVYVFLCIGAFFFLLVVAIVCGVYSDKMANFNTLDTVRDKGDEWIDNFEEKLTEQVLTLSEKYPITWNNTQAAIGCCGWNIKNGTATGFTNSKCCQDSTVVTSVNVIGKFELDVAGCRKDSNDEVYTCEGIVASHIQDNLVKTSIFSAVMAIVQLALAICGCVVRYPKCFAYCDCNKKKRDAHYTPEETPVNKFKPDETPH